MKNYLFWQQELCFKLGVKKTEGVDDRFIIDVYGRQEK